MPKKMYTLHLGDALETMRKMKAGSVDCVFVDLPYYGIVSEDWDNQWKTKEDYLDWVVSLAHEWKRITKDNSSVFVFCDEKMEAYIQVRLDEIFLLLNKIVWYRKTNEMKKYAKNFRRFAPATERALFYTTQYDPTGWEAVKLDMNNFTPLREYFREFQEALGMNIKQINTRLGHRKAEHAFYWNSTQWDLPTPETYQELLQLPRNGFKPKEYEALRQEYEALRQEYEALRQEYEALRRPFNADSETFDVLEFPAYDGIKGIDHPTPKSLPLCRRILSVINIPGNVVLDCCMGSGTAGVAALELGMPFIGIENNPRYFAIAENRIAQSALQPGLFTASNNTRTLTGLSPEGKQGELFSQLTSKPSPGQ